MSRTYALIVTDTSPLITLALADELDLLLRPGIPVSIPDAVYIEATRIRTAGGASTIVEWLNAHLDQVHIIPIEVGIDVVRRAFESAGVEFIDPNGGPRVRLRKSPQVNKRK